MIVAVIAGGVWGAAQMIIAGEREDNMECTAQLNTATERCNSVCDTRIVELTSSCDTRVESVTLYFDECLDKILRISAMDASVLEEEEEEL